MSVRILEGDALTVLRTLPDQSVQCCVTSPPYWGLRDYGVDGQLGLERTPDAYVAAMVAVFSEVRRVLRNDGTLWLNIGDSYCASPKGSLNGQDKSGLTSTRTQENSPVGISKLPSRIGSNPKGGQGNTDVGNAPHRARLDGFKPKDLIGIPWMLAFALRSDGWYLRQCNIWAKPNGMPESVSDRPTSSHEYVFLLSKSARYFYDIDAARTRPAPSTETRLAQNVADQEGSLRAAVGTKSNGAMKAVQRKRLPATQANLGALRDKQRGHGRVHAGFNARWNHMEREEQMAGGSNLRSVWWLSPAQYREAHFAVMPPTLAEICITAGSKKGDTILDPFSGAGTTALVADRMGRDAIGIELNPEYAAMSRRRIHSDNPLFGDVA